ncbi:MAG: hypothetical protein EBX52_03960 [Proteobacteria bacterium]|nr:hypothetical protein [Pseudomonadota bacterium]
MVESRPGPSFALSSGMTPHPWIESVSDILANALDVLSPAEIREIFSDIEYTHPELAPGSLLELLSEFESLPVLVRITPAFSETAFVMEWARKKGVPVELNLHH